MSVVGKKESTNRKNQKGIVRLLKRGFPGFRGTRNLICNPPTHGEVIHHLANQHLELEVISGNYSDFLILRDYAKENEIISFLKFTTQFTVGSLNGIEDIRISTRDSKTDLPKAELILDKVYYGLPIPELGKYDETMFFISKSKPENLLMLKLLALIGHNDSVIYVIGHNSSGGKSFGNLAGKFFRLVGKQATMAHHVLWKVQYPLKRGKITHADIFSDYRFTAGKATIPIRNIHGVFSEKQLDNGSQLLLDVLLSKYKDKTIEGDCWDIGSGAGVLLMALLANHIVKGRCYVTDISYSALLSSSINFLLNGYSNLSVLPAGTSHSFDGNASLVVSNPPFHLGKEQDLSIFSSIVEYASSLLVKSGSFICVANSFLKYIPIMKRHFSQVDTLATTPSYSVYRGIK